MAIIGSLVADLSANSAAFNRDMSQATNALRSNSARMNRSLGAIDRGFASVKRNMGGIARQALSMRGALTAAVGIGGFGVMTQQSLEAADAAAKLARSTGFTVEQISALQYQASQTGALDGFDRALGTLAYNLGQLRVGTGPLLTFLREYDRDLARTLAGTEDQAEAVNVLADAISRETDVTQRVALARAAFGRTGTQLTNTFAEGRQGIARYREEAQRLGIVLGTDNAEAAERFNDAMDRIQRQVRQRWTVAITEHTDDVLDAARAWQDLRLGALRAAAAVSRSMNMGRGLAARDPEASARTLEEAAQMYTLRATGARDRGTLLTAEQRLVARAVGASDGGALHRQITEMLRNAEHLPDAYLEAAARLREEAQRVRQAAEEAAEIEAELASRRGAGAPADGEDGDGVGRSGGRDLFGEGDPFGDMLTNARETLKAHREGLRGEARALFEATRTEVEVFQAEIARIGDLERGGFFADAGGADTAIRARVAALVQMASAADDTRTAFAELRRLTQAGLIDPAAADAARAQIELLREPVRGLKDDLRDVLEGGLRSIDRELLDALSGFKSFGEAATSIIRSIAMEFQRLAIERLVTDPLRRGLNALFDIGLAAVTGGASSAGKPGKKFQRGGRFTVAGAGGVDSQLVSFWGTPGEEVEVRPTGPAGRAFSGGGGASAGGGIVMFAPQYFHLHAEGAVMTEELIESMDQRSRAHAAEAREDARLQLARMRERLQKKLR
ncbi:MAG: hypothetical protein ABL308_12675 [Oceanicaulis sp.]